MSKILMLKGLPASGKSTYAKQLVALGGWKRVNKDDLRAMLDDGKWSRGNEKIVLEARDDLIDLALNNSLSVVVDDTNFAPQHERDLREIADQHKIPFEVKFFDTDPEECIKRDLARSQSVGKDVIMQMYKQYVRPKPAPPVYDHSLPEAIIVDIDGTLAHMVNRGPYDPTLYHTDALDTTIRDLAGRYHERGIQTIVCSGRDDTYREVTERWLSLNGVTFNHLFMRPGGDKRKDSIVKRELYEQNIAGKFNIVFVLDDRDQVVDMWRNELGLKVLQVAEGDF